MQHTALTVKTNSVLAFELFSFFKVNMRCNLVANQRMLTESFCLMSYALMSLTHPPHEQVDRLTAIIASEKNLIHNFVVVSGNAGITVNAIRWCGMRSRLSHHWPVLSGLCHSAISGPLRFEPSLCSSPLDPISRRTVLSLLCFNSFCWKKKWRSSLIWDMPDTHGLNWPAVNLNLRNSVSA